MLAGMLEPYGCWTPHPRLENSPWPPVTARSASGGEGGGGGGGGDGGDGGDARRQGGVARRWWWHVRPGGARARRRRRPLQNSHPPGVAWRKNQPPQAALFLQWQPRLDILGFRSVLLLLT
ncbi:Protein of unknown function [Gryllus bimaculatus]|nr:Protein of unknown function [Gryllus bimaculatus]